jgi:hypothetical protein
MVVAVKKHDFGLTLRRAWHLGNSDKIFGISHEITWYDQNGVRVDAKADENVAKGIPLSPEQWFQEVALRFFMEGVYRQKIGQVAIAPVLGQSFTTLASRGNRAGETTSHVITPINAEGQPTAMDYVFDISVGGFAAKDIQRIILSIRTEEAKLAGQIATEPHSAVAKDFYAKMDSGLVPTILAAGADIWTAKHEIVIKRYTPPKEGEIGWNPVPGAKTVTINARRNLIIPKAGGGIWTVAKHGSVAMHEDKLPLFAQGVLRVAAGEKIADVFYDKDAAAPHGVKLKPEFDSYVQTERFRDRALRMDEPNPAHRDLTQQVRALIPNLKQIGL